MGKTKVKQDPDTDPKPTEKWDTDLKKSIYYLKMFIELLHYYVMAQSQWAHYNTV